MKIFYCILITFFISDTSWSQRSVQLGVLPPNGGLINLTPNRIEQNALAKKKNSKAIDSDKTLAASGLITDSEIAIGAINSHNQPFQYNKDLDLLTYFCNKSSVYTSSSNSNKGNVVCYYSSNNGISWDSTLIYSNANYYAALVGGAIYNPIGNINPLNARLVSAAPINNDTNWVGNFYASKPISFPGGNSNSMDVQTVLSKNLPSGGLQKHHLAYSDFSVTEDGNAHAIGEILNNPMATTNSQYGYRGVAVVKGVFTSGAFIWTSDSIIPPTKLRADGSKYLYHQAMSAWNNAGNVGYVVFYGVDINGVNSSNTFQPIIYKTTNSGATWVKLPLLCFYSYTSAGGGCYMGPLSLYNIEAVSTNSNLTKPFFSMKEGADVTVDANNNLHIFSNIVSAASNHPDSLDYVYAYTSEKFSFKNIPLSYPVLWDLYTSPGGYSIIKIDSMGTEGVSGMVGAPGFTSNVWDDGMGGKLSLNARLQLSRSYDGTKLFYSWSETDSIVTGNHWNIYPDVKVKGVDFNTLKMTQRFDITGSSMFAAGQGYFHYVSPLAKNINSGTWNIPIVFSTNSTYSFTASLPISNYHLNGFNITQPSFSIYVPKGVCYTTSIIESKSMSKINIYPNPSVEKIIISISDFMINEIYEVSVVDMLGRELKKIKILNAETEIDGIKSGLYFVNLFKKGAILESKKIIVSN